jgi:Fe(3+) dicitrate transport protein
MSDMKICIFSLLIFASGEVAAQSDTLNPRYLDSVTITSYISDPDITRLADIQGTYSFGGKKTEVIHLENVDADITNKSGRQAFAKIPGVFVYDMDGAGNQINIATRGLDPHRGWEFNNRKDGIIINSDMYGYPASHYSMPLESISRIELVRGTGSLQYGAQFGGMLNYVSKTCDTTRTFSFESVNTLGSYNLISSFNAVGGKSGRFRYYAYVNRKSRNGYRDNEHTDSESEDVTLEYKRNDRLSIRAEWARSKYLYRIPGGLTDAQFHANPRQATRSRNYFSPDIHIPSVTANWQASPSTRLQLTTSAVLGRRNSVQFDRPTNVEDTIVTATGRYNNRQVDIDRFNSYTTELRILQQYGTGSGKGTVIVGVQYMNNDLHRTQLGKGTTGSEYDLTLVDAQFERDVHFKTRNIAVFAENNLPVTRNFSFNAGARVESGTTDLTGRLNYYPENEVPVRISHHYPLLGVSFSYKAKKNSEIYGGWSQAYHPMLFKDLIPVSVYERADQHIRDSKGYNAELGTRGQWSFLKWDVSAFLVQIDNRFGTLSQTDDQGQFYTWRTNIGNSLTTGLEIFMQGDWMIGSRSALTVFTSTSFTHARYTAAVVKSGNTNVNVRGNKVESAPDLITRNGITYRIRRLSVSMLYSFTSATYADALNTKIPPVTTGAVGLVPSYGLADLNTSFRLSKTLEFRLNVSNLTNKQYFTKRPAFYPGPGVWPSEGRNFNGSVIIKL